MENSRPKPGRMEETLEGGRVPPRAVGPLERERERDLKTLVYSARAENKDTVRQHVFYACQTFCICRGALGKE